MKDVVVTWAANLKVNTKGTVIKHSSSRFLIAVFVIGTQIAPADEVDPRELRQAIVSLQAGDDSDMAVSKLLALDQRIVDSQLSNQKDLLRLSLLALAQHGTPAAVEHIRSVFETQTYRRDSAAVALSLFAMKRPIHDQDWRYLVRSLPIMNSDDAVSVVNALLRFRQRATRPEWIREVILIGLRLPESDLPIVIQLLGFWSGQGVSEAIAPREQLREYQAWFEQSFPFQPRPELPLDLPGANWTWDKLFSLVTALPENTEATATGVAAYEKAGCAKCHRKDGVTVGQSDDRLGPDLTSLGWRRQPAEILSAVLYPSHRLNDDYPVTTVLLTSGKAFSGLMMPETDDRVKVVASDGTSNSFSRDEIEESIPSRVSNMPVGLLEPLLASEIEALFGFLTSQSARRDPHARMKEE